MPLSSGKTGGVSSLARRATNLVVKKGLISHQEILRFGIRTRDFSQSNGVAFVEAGNGRGFLAKDMRGTRSRDQGSPERELALYNVLEQHEELRHFAPAFHGYDSDQAIMLLEGLMTYRRFDQLDGGKFTLDDEFAHHFGALLGSWHAGAASINKLAPIWPWFLNIDGNDRLDVINNDQTLRELVDAMLTKDKLKKTLDEVRSAWKTETVIHGDVRFANTMVLRSPPTLRFIDWETCGLGDPAWDVAGAVQEYISVAISGGNKLETSAVTGPVRAFLESYEESSPFPMPWSRIAPFVSCRLMMRAIQLANWGGGAEGAIDEHVDMAEELACTQNNPFGSVQA